MKNTSYRPRIRRVIATMMLLGSAGIAMAVSGTAPKYVVEDRRDLPGGQLLATDGGSQVVPCPLRHTDVTAQISGYVSRVHVKQIFHNPLSKKIEATYVFPLPQDAAVDDMTMTVGSRKIRGLIKPKEEARKIYEQAKQAGKVAGLLDQERPNIFTQAVANIEPGAQVTIDISYVETLKYDSGSFEWSFPTVVGPRYMPGAEQGKAGNGWSRNTDRVPDASKISPWITPPRTRAGHDISVTVNIDTGMGLHEVQSSTHPILVKKGAPGQAAVTLKQETTLPNKDFILRYRVGTEKIEDALLLHSDSRGHFFTLILQPPRRVAPASAVPKEMIFVIDRSGSMDGAPIEKAKETMTACIKQMNPSDTFNLYSFFGGMGKAFKTPVANTAANRNYALRYLKDLYGSGGTEMMPAVMEALGGAHDASRVRIVCFMTDGYVGNDMEIIDAIKKNIGTSRVFSFGIGSSVNRFLLENMADAGRGASEFVTLNAAGDKAAKRFRERIHSPVLTDIKIDWGDLPVDEVYPSPIPDVFSYSPLMIHGRLKSLRKGTLTLRGRTAAGLFERKITIDPAQANLKHDSLPSLWARAKIKKLMMADMGGMQRGGMNDELKKAITDLGVTYRLMTQFTSFVAVEEKTVTKGAAGETVAVPVEMPEGVSYKAHAAAVQRSPAGQLGSGASSQMFAAQPGDPLIQIAAPADAQQIVAIFPGGEVKRLQWNRDTKLWEARFDIPGYATEGKYEVTVITVLKDGTRRRFALRYRVDMTSPQGAGRGSLVSSKNGNAAARQLHLELDTSNDTDRVKALLPWGANVEMKRSIDDPQRFTSLVSIPAHYRGRVDVVSYILTDAAHNRTTVTVDISR